MSVGKKLRFEVFKRDSFTCQYCGQKAPDVVLECDHIKPRAAGGADDILNLATSCIDCNRGKGARELSDDTVLERQRTQLEELQERREQIDMMVDWQRSLVGINDSEVAEAVRFWCDLAEWEGIKATGHKTLRGLIRKHGLGAVLTAMRASVSYFQYDDEGEITDESSEHAFSKVGGIVRVTIAEQDKPWLKDMFYTRGIVRNRMYCNDRLAKSLLEQTYEIGVPTEETRRIALSARNWSQWRDQMEDLIANRGLVNA